MQYPEDTTDTRTEYSYDEWYRLLVGVTADTSSGKTLEANYTYTDDQLSTITTGSTTYNFAYGDFAQTSEIKVGEQTLATYSYTDVTNYLETLAYGNGDSVSYTYDKHGRVSETMTEHTYTDRDVMSEYYTYYSPGENLTSSQVSQYRTDTAGDYDVTYSYTYDENGNILSVSDGTNTTSYEYDSANQLLRENNQAAGTTTVWTYDDAGNILTRKEYAYTTGAVGTETDFVTYTYGNSNWGDQLTSYDGQTIEYDEIGNPLTDGTWTYTWKHGRELESMTNGTTTWEHTYNVMEISPQSAILIYTTHGGR